MVEISATTKYLRVSPRKLREVADVVRGMNTTKALDQLKFLPKSATKPLMQSLKSALANATHNLKLNGDNLRIKTVEINEGPRLKRFRAVSRGVAHQYKRRTSHLKVVLEEVSRGTENKS